jgi:hypothetical protein
MVSFSRKVKNLISEIVSVIKRKEKIMLKTFDCWDYRYIVIINSLFSADDTLKELFTEIV